MANFSEPRRDFLKTVGLGAAGLTMAQALQAGGKPGRRPNVLLYVVDDQGTDDAGCYGNPVIRTPGLDALAADGVRFTNAFCTTASCSASRSVILTGLHNHANGQYGHAHAYHHFSSFANVVSLPAMLGAAGYRTALAGKCHVAPDAVYKFDDYVDRDFIGHESPEAMAEKMRDFIGADSDRPFFLYFCTREPHRPFWRDGSTPVDPKDVIVPPYLPDTPECRAELARYYMSVERADKGLARLTRILKETGRWDDTLVIFISDNGIAFPGAKTTAYDPALRLPCVVRNPFGKARGAVNHAMISWADLTPTILD
ncbi:MAG: sulfatase, partial [bacterium]|nr:sulfatase [bacterium]